MRRRSDAPPLLPLWDDPSTLGIDAEIASLALKLHEMWKAGDLGGEQMPEDAHPPMARGSDELALYFTLGMTLNYQRNSYALWRACTAAFEDPSTRWVFDPAAVVAADRRQLADALLHHRVALQPNRHPQIWWRNAAGLVEYAGGSVKALFARQAYDLGRVKDFVAEHRASFPYLSGPKISNYWLYVLSTYLDWPTHGRASLTVAPDTHVVAASLRLGLLAEHPNRATLSAEVARRWSEVLVGTPLLPIDIHTPLWLWSRAGFPAVR